MGLFFELGCAAGMRDCAGELAGAASLPKDRVFSLAPAKPSPPVATESFPAAELDFPVFFSAVEEDGVEVSAFESVFSRLAQPVSASAAVRPTAVSRRSGVRGTIFFRIYIKGTLT